MVNKPGIRVNHLGLVILVNLVVQRLVFLKALLVLSQALVLVLRADLDKLQRR